jgi:SAM-dependent methyltransferase
MRQAARENLEAAAAKNPWFDPSFVDIRDGHAEDLPAEDGSAGLVAQNCLFNVFVAGDLARALGEVHRVLGQGGRFSTSDPITTEPLPPALRRNQTLRARCISGCITYDEYLRALLDAGFDQLVVRARVPYRLLLPSEHPELAAPILLESLEVLAVKLRARPAPPQVFTGRTATYRGSATHAERAGFTFARGVPCPISDGLAGALAADADFLLGEPTFHARSTGCC